MNSLRSTQASERTHDVAASGFVLDDERGRCYRA